MIRSNFSLFDEAGKIDRDFYALTLPFSAQDTNFVTGGGINTDCYPIQLPNKNLFLSSAEGIDSELYERYKLCFEKMMLGDPNYFVCDIDCTFSLNPMKDGKPFRPLITKQVVDDAMHTNPYKAEREYFNRFDKDGGQDVFVKRSTINKFSQPYVPIFRNVDEKKYLISYDPSSKLDNSVILIGELFRDEERGLMLKLVNCVNLVEMSKTGEKLIIQQPEQIEKLKDIILAYNGNAVDYDNIVKLIIDAGAGGGGFQIAQNIMPEWVGSDRKIHRGWIDLDDQYMKAREDDYVGNCNKLKMFSATKDKVKAYESAQSAINQGLVIFPVSPNIRGEIEFEKIDEEGKITVTYEKVNKEELTSLIQMDIAKEQLIGMQKIVNNGKVRFELSHEKQLQSNHDDHADTVTYMLDTLMDMRAEEALVKEKPKSDFNKMLEKAKGSQKRTNNPFSIGGNPFGNSSANPFN